MKLFNRLLEREKLKVDRDGNARTAYSLRHTYICLRLTEGADVYQIAKNCRTSVEMIQKFYAAHIKNVDRHPRRDPAVSAAKSFMKWAKGGCNGFRRRR